jgi:hypothetical protein
MAEEQMPEDGSIPLRYGKLISVSSVGEYPEFLQLWFQDEMGVIRMVRYSINENRILKVSHVIERR